MNFFVYIIKTTTKTITKTYVGYTNNLKNRLDKHNNNQGAKSTKGHKWKIIYKKKFISKSEAMSYEYKLKKDRKLRSKILNEIYLNE
jgi:putative endonuclease|tara:strand:+ start:4087 stop:4347 length:261 start_codon:yes stop_codon:yes gene_type:complete